MQEVLVNRIGGLSLPRKSVVRLTDRPDMTLDVYHGCKTTIQEQYNNDCVAGWLVSKEWITCDFTSFFNCMYFSSIKKMGG